MTAIPITFVSSHAADGGSERYLRRLIAALGAEWVHEIVSLQDGPLVAGLRADGHRVTVIDVPPRPPGLVTRSLALRKHLRSTGAQLVHANGIKAALACTSARLGSATRVLWVKHDFSFEGALASSIGACVDRIVGVSRACIANLRGPAARKATFVHTGIDHVDVDRNSARSALVGQLGWPSDAFVVGAVGRLDPAKGHRELIRAVAEARDRIPNVHVVIAGAVDPNHPRTKQRLEVAGREHAIGDRLAVFDDRDDVRSLMAAFDVGVIPTIATRRGGREGFSLVALEMLDAGTPVVGFDSGALPEVLGRCGRLAPEGNISGLAAALAAVAEDRALRTRMAECGPERVRDSFTVEGWIDGMKKQYRSVAGDRR